MAKEWWDDAPLAEEAKADSGDWWKAAKLADAEPPKSRSWGEAAKDTGSSVLGGFAGLVKSAGDLYGLATGNMDNAVSEVGKNSQEFWESSKSEALKEKLKTRKSDIDAQDSIGAKAWSAFKGTVTDPALLADMTAGQAANLLPAGLVGRGVNATLAAKTAMSAANAAKVATGAAVGTGAIQQGADVSGAVFDASMKMPDAVWDKNPEFVSALNEAGQDTPTIRKAIKEKLSLTAARVTFPAAAAISVAANALPGGSVIEKALVGGSAKQTIKQGTRAATVQAMTKGMLGEAVSEGLEEGGGAFSGNLAKKNIINADQSLDEGVGESAGLGAAGGFAMGGAAGAFHTQAPKITPADIVSPSVTTVDDAIKTAEASISDKATSNIGDILKAANEAKSSADEQLIEQIRATAPVETIADEALNTPATSILEAQNAPNQAATQAQAIEAGAFERVAPEGQPDTNTIARADALETPRVNDANTVQTEPVAFNPADSSPATDSGINLGGRPLFSERVDSVVQPDAVPVQNLPQAKDARLTPVSQRPSASWVIRDKETGSVVTETFDKKKVDALNTEKYEAVPIATHLASLGNRSSIPSVDQRLIPVSQRVAPVVESIPVTPPEIRAEQMRQQKIKSARAGNLRNITHKKSPFLAFLGKHGVNISERREFSPDKNPMLSGYGPMFRKAGEPIDTLVAKAIEEGFLPEGTNDDSKLRDLISRTLGGESIAPLYSEDGATDAMQAEIDKRASFEDYVDAAPSNETLKNLDFIPEDAEVSGYNDLSAASQNRIQALLAQATDLGIDAESILEKIQDDTREKSADIYYAEAIRQLEEVNAAGATGSSEDAGEQSQAVSTEEGLTSQAQFDEKLASILRGQRSRQGGIIQAKKFILDNSALTKPFISPDNRATMATLDAYLEKEARKARVGVADEIQAEKAKSKDAWYDLKQAALERKALEQAADFNKEMDEQGDAPIHPSLANKNEGLTAPSREGILAQQERAAQAEKAQAAADKAADKATKQAADKKEIDARQAASADNFQLGQSAEDSLSGQASMFDAPAEKPASEMSVQDLLRAAAQKMDDAAKPQAADVDKAAEKLRDDAEAKSLVKPDQKLPVANESIAKPAIKDDVNFSVSDTQKPVGNWYSELNRQIESSKTNVMPANMWTSWINSLKGVKPDEIEWSGVQDWLKLQTGKVTKADLSNYLSQNGVQVQETVLSGDGQRKQYINELNQLSRADLEARAEDAGVDIDSIDGNRTDIVNAIVDAEEGDMDFGSDRSGGASKYSQYQLPGGENYREVLLTLPEKTETPLYEALVKKYGKQGSSLKQVATAEELAAVAKESSGLKVVGEKVYKSSHWDQKNVLAHIRVNDRTDADGKRVLFVEEIQSDWGQDGKKKGFAGAPTDANVKIEKDGKEFTVTRNGVALFSTINETRANEVLARELAKKDSGVPAAPFVTATDKWLSLALKRVVKMAVDGGYDKVAFVNGEQSADRYDLSKQVQEVRVARIGKTKYDILFTDKDGKDNRAGEFTEDKLADAVGKELAEKIINNRDDRQTYAGLDLKVGGEGMKAFYDKIVPNTAKEVIRKLGGGQMETATITVDKSEWKITPPSQTVSGRWMVKSSDYNSKGLQFDTEAEAKSALLKKQATSVQQSFAITEAMREKAIGGLPLFSIAEKTEYTPTNGTEPASTQQQALADELARRINNGAGKGRRVPTVLHAVNAGSGSNADLRRTVTATRSFSKSIFGHTTVFVDFEGETLFRGAMSDAIPDTIFLDIKSDKPHMAVLGHELLHQLRKTAPDIYERLNERLNQVLKPDALNKYSKALIAKYEAKGLKAPTNIDEELTGDIVGDNFNDPEFLKLLGENQPAGFRKVLDSIAKFLDDVLAKLTGKNRPFGTDQYLTDIKAAREAVAIAMREFSGSQVGAMTNERVTDDVKFSSGKPLQTDTPAFKAWFGDSKVVDSEGKPLVVYHGTSADFDVFNAEKLKNGWLGKAFYFAEDKALALDNGKKIKQVFLKIDRPFVVEGGSPSDVLAEAKALYPSINEFNLKEVLAQNGYDGVSFTHWDSGAMYAAFSPEQIKSATGNNGNFDASNPDIRFSVANKDAVPGETDPQKAQRVVQDKFNRFKVLQKWLTDKGVDLSEAADVYLAETLMSGRVASRKEDFRENQMKPLIQKTQKAKISMEQIGDYLKAQHAPEANKRAQQIHNDPTATAYGVSDAEAQATIAEFQQLPNFVELKSIAAEWRDITSQTKKVLLDGGILSKDMVAAWDATYSAYIPVKGTEESQGTGKGLSVNGKTKRRMGHELRDEAILENILRDHERAISLDEKNNVGKALIRFALEAKNNDIITIGQPEKRQIMKAGEVMLQASPMLAENEVNVYVDGHAIRVQINDEIAARAYINLGVEHLNVVLAAGREVNTWLSKVYTAYSPDFIFTNPIRDAIQGSMTLTGEYGAATAAKIFTNYRRAALEMIKHARNHGSSQLINDYRANGGSTGAAYLSDLERIGNDLQASYNEYAGVMDTYSRTLEQATQDGKKFPHTVAALKAGSAGFKKVPVVGHFLRLLESINSVTENALRVATYDTLVKEGVSPKKAAAQAKNLMNFNRKGEIANQAGAFYLFFNPSVQGSQVMYRALFDSEHKGQVKALAGMMVLSAVALAELAMSGGADDEDKWKNTPSYVKDSNLIFGFGDMQYMLPLPYGYRLFHMLGNVMSEYKHGADGYKLGIRFASGVFSNLSPVGNPMEGNSGVVSVLPTVAKIAVGPTVNQDSFGREITPKQWNNAMPDSQIMNRPTKGTAFASVAESLNDLTGGTKYTKGMVDVSPETLKYWVNTIFGGTGKFVGDLVNSPYKASQGVDVPLKEMPIVRRFAREIGVSDARSAFWERAKEAKEAADAFGAAKKAHDGLGMQSILNDNKALLDMAKYADRQQKMIKAKRDEVDRINADKDLTLKQKDEKVKLIEMQEAAVYTKFIKTFDAQTKK